jgi:UDP-3-O-[3-hydroxymyristoyl] glucosamine N-acyltransferase
MNHSLGELAVRFGCELRGDPAQRLSHVATLAGGGDGTLGFIASPHYRAQLAVTRVSAVVLAAAELQHCRVNALVHANPHATFARMAALLHPAARAVPGVAATAVIAPDARVPASAHIAPGAVIGAGAELGERCVIGAGAVVGASVRIGADSELRAHTTLEAGTVLGERVLIHAGAVIGADGFGFARDAGQWVKVPQVGVVRIGSDVEIGANTTIDRGAIDDTVIGDGVKIDNQVQIGHNCVIGDHTVISAFCGLSGSTRIGRRCMLGGGVGFVGHQTIGDDVAFTGDCLITGDIDRPGVWSGALPAQPQREWQRLVARFKRLDRLALQVRRLAKQLGEDSEHD